MTFEAFFVSESNCRLNSFFSLVHANNNVVYSLSHRISLKKDDNTHKKVVVKKVLKKHVLNGRTEFQVTIIDSKMYPTFRNSHAKFNNLIVVR